MAALLRGTIAHTRRLLHTSLAAALAVGLVVGTFVLTDTVEAAFDAAAAPGPADVDTVVRAASPFAAEGNSLPEREPLPPSLVDTVTAVPGVASAWGSVWGYAQLVDKAGRAIAPQGLPTIGTSSAPNDDLTEGRAPAGADEVAIDSVSAREHGFDLGDRVKVVFHDAVGEFVVRGIQTGSDVVAATLATFEMGTAQRLLGRADRLDAIAVQGEPGVAAEVLRARIGDVLPGGFEAVTNNQAAKESKESWTNALGFVTTGLFAFAAVALLVGSFIIFNTFSIVVAQRTREFGLLRALGASRAQLMASVLSEAVAVGLVASVAGILLGLGSARGLLAVMGRIGVEVPDTTVVFLPRTAVIGLACGVLVTALAAVLPAHKATRVAPVEGMSHDLAGEVVGRRRRRHLVGWSAALVGIGALVAGLYAGPESAGPAVGLGAAAFLVWLGVLVPVLATPAARALGAPLARCFGEPAKLGRENAMRHPRRTAVTAAALTVGIALIGVVAILGSSMKASATKALGETMRADFVIEAKGTPGLSGGIPPAVAARLAETPGVGVVSAFRAGQWGRNGTTETVLAVDPATVATVHELDPASMAAAERLTDHAVVVRDSVAARHGWRVGDLIPMTFARTGTRQLRLAATFTATAVSSDYVISLPTFQANFTQQLDAEVRVRTVPGLSPAEARRRVQAALVDFPNVDILDRSQALAAQRTQVNRILVPVTALLLLSVLIALLGIANTLALSIHERTREIGLLRAIGMARSQLRWMIRTEAVIIASLGAVLGAAVAVFFGWVLVSLLGDLGVTELRIPYGQLLGWVIVAALAGLLASILPARRAARLDVLRAVAGD